MNSLVTLIGSALSIFGMGTSTISQVGMMRQQMSPPAIQQQCPPNTTPTTVTTPQGQQQLICVQEAAK